MQNYEHFETAFRNRTTITSHRCTDVQLLMSAVLKCTGNID